MAKLWFKFGSMGSTKSATLLQTAYNYRERKMTVDVFKPAIDTRDAEGFVTSRTGSRAPCFVIGEKDSFRNFYRDRDYPKIILVDEAQFLQPAQVSELRDIVDIYGVVVICYGLRTDFKRQLFPASALLLGIADCLEEIPGICFCGSRAKFVLRLDQDGNVLTDGPQVLVGGNDRYVPVCSKHWLSGQYEGVCENESTE